MSVQNQPHNKKSNILFVGDLPKEITYEDLSTLFKDYHIQFASLNNSKLTNIWAQVVFENEEWANKARHELNGEILIPKLSKDLKGKPIRICKFESKNSINQEKNKNYIVSIGDNQKDDIINEYKLNENFINVYREKFFIPINDKISINIPLISNNPIIFYFDNENGTITKKDYQRFYMQIQ